MKVTDYVLVLTAIDDVKLSREVCDLCRENRVVVNVADFPPECDFYFGAQIRRGPLQIMVSTQGMGPKVGVMIRDHIEKGLPNNVEEAIEGVGLLRKDLRSRVPEVGGESSKRRMEWMKSTCDAWSLDQMGEFRDEKVRAKVLDEGWEKDRIVRPRDVGIGGSWAVDFGGWQTGLALSVGIFVGFILSKKR
jgi:precorrin-2 dehydrogenase / sirohydrochlorin ferrochelatase